MKASCKCVTFFAIQYFFGKNELKNLVLTFHHILLGFAYLYAYCWDLPTYMHTVGICLPICPYMFKIC